MNDYPIISQCVMYYWYFEFKSLVFSILNNYMLDFEGVSTPISNNKTRI